MRITQLPVIFYSCQIPGREGQDVRISDELLPVTDMGASVLPPKDEPINPSKPLLQACCVLRSQRTDERDEPDLRLTGDDELRASREEFFLYRTERVRSDSLCDLQNGYRYS